ncbi:5-oxoprolinase/urea amidolyase family protein [Bifidobacterium callitrichos]|uniref:5-oxoprolinase/urea amidolyase family protein n=1 Tax=Bifidobacterium callitrichos TaxID=762209 RepID=A0A5M9ZAL3_9BIFI|nr:urea amidolyase family protein [Bifidobacterium callitrichos]KAA8815510.1 5-oxoprolinase/urea amidolyase family protein [Bifidobacterium callitrichos]
MNATNVRFLPCGDAAVLVELADLDATLRLYAAIDRAVTAAVGGSGDDSVWRYVTGLLPAARTVLVSYDPLAEAMFHVSAHRKSDRTAPMSGYTTHVDAGGYASSTGAASNAAGDTHPHGFRACLCDAIARLDTPPLHAGSTRVVEIPVVYDGEDLSNVARMLGVSESEVVARHSGHPWTVAFGGFAPGFDYLTGGDPIFDVSRRTSPRLAVPAGAVGLAGTFSGVYPRSSSGGWQLIGTTDTPMWDESATPPALLSPADTVRFTPVRAQVRLDRTDHAIVQQPEQSDARPHSVEAGPVGDSTTASPTSDGHRQNHIAHTAHVTCSDASSVVPAVAALEVRNPGMLSTFQDEGRDAARMGVTGSGAADRRAFRLVNNLVGNPAGTPVIEITGGDASFVAHGDLTVAVAGAPVDITISGTDTIDMAGIVSATGYPTTFHITQQEAFLLRDGETLTIGTPRAGFRDYLAVRGGFDVPKILNSASTDTMSHLGPQPLHPEQLLAIRISTPSTSSCDCPATVGLPEPWPDDLPRIDGSVTTLTVTMGPRDDWFTADGIATFLDQEWTVTARSNRVGLRLEGARSLQRLDSRELASEATLPGAIEVPTSGQPVLFLRDQPVTGGYPVIAVLTRASLDLAGQLPPGARIRFVPQSPTQAPPPTPLTPSQSQTLPQSPAFPERTA